MRIVGIQLKMWISYLAALSLGGGFSLPWFLRCAGFGARLMRAGCFVGAGLFVWAAGRQPFCCGFSVMMSVL